MRSCPPLSARRASLYAVKSAVVTSAVVFSRIWSVWAEDEGGRTVAAWGFTTSASSRAGFEAVPWARARLEGLAGGG